MQNAHIKIKRWKIQRTHSLLYTNKHVLDLYLNGKKAEELPIHLSDFIKDVEVEPGVYLLQLRDEKNGKSSAQLDVHLKPGETLTLKCGYEVEIFPYLLVDVGSFSVFFLLSLLTTASLFPVPIIEVDNPKSHKIILSVEDNV